MFDGETTTTIDWTNAFEKLPSRQEAKRRLTEVLRNDCVDGERKHALVIITGPTGVGKTSLAYGVESLTIDIEGYFLCGKFDQLSTTSETATSPYTPFVNAFTHYVDLVVNAGDTRIKAVKQRLETSMELSERQVLLDMIPALKRILSDPSHTSERGSVIKGWEAERRFVHIFELFVQAICSVGNPIVLFLDDIQWAGRSALHLFTNLAIHGNDIAGSHFVLLSTCRSDELSPDHLVSSMLREINAQKINSIEIKIANLTLDECNEVISEALCLSADDAEPLSRILFEQTCGNELFLTSLVDALRESGILWCNEFREWQLDRRQLMRRPSLGSIPQLIVRKVLRLPQSAQDLLKTASCLGCAFSETVLRHTGVVACNLVIPVFLVIEEAGLVHFDNESRIGRFVHDRVQQAVYVLVPETERASLHLQIGRRLWKKLPRDIRDDHLVLIAHQISGGVDLIHDPVERHDISQMFFWAGQKAAIASDFQTSAAFLNLGIKLLNRGHWTHSYEHSLRLYNFAAEIEYYNGNLARVDKLIAVAMKRATSLEDTLRLHFIRIYSLGSRNEMGQALNEGLRLLESLGEKFPRKPNSVHAVISFLRCQWVLRKRSNEEILDLPTLIDRKMQATMKLMLLLCLYAYYVNDAYLPLLSGRLIELIMRHGLSDIASGAFAVWGLIHGQLGLVDKAYQFSQLALRILEATDAKEWRAWVFCLTYAGVFPLKRPYRDLIEPMRDAHRCGLVVGDIQFAVLCAALYSDLTYLAGFSLDKVYEEVKNYRSLCLRYGQHSMLPHASLSMQFCLNLMGKSKDPLVLTGDIMNEDDCMHTLQQNKNQKDSTWLLVLKLALAVYMNNVSAAQVVQSQLRKENSRLRHFFATQLFFEALTSALSSRSIKSERQHAMKVVTKFRSMARHSPSNYLHKAYLIEAELATIAGNHDHARLKYDNAIEQAGLAGCIHEQALCCERAFQAHQLLPRSEHHATRYLTQARALYHEWGAAAKLNQLAAFV